MHTTIHKEPKLCLSLFHPHLLFFLFFLPFPLSLCLLFSFCVLFFLFCPFTFLSFPLHYNITPSVPSLLSPSCSDCFPSCISCMLHLLLYSTRKLIKKSNSILILCVMIRRQSNPIWEKIFSRFTKKQNKVAFFFLI